MFLFICMVLVNIWFFISFLMILFLMMKVLCIKMRGLIISDIFVQLYVEHDLFWIEENIRVWLR